MKEFFNKYQKVIFRIAGGLMLLISFVIYFWSTPKDGLTQNQIAAANVARMEARVSGGSGTQKTQSSSAEIMKAYKDTQATQNRYVLIFIMIMGVGFLGFSFIKRD